jgi:hypothetical protein
MTPPIIMQRLAAITLQEGGPPKIICNGKCLVRNLSPDDCTFLPHMLDIGDRFAAKHHAQHIYTPASESTPAKVEIIKNGMIIATLTLHFKILNKSDWDRPCQSLFGTSCYNYYTIFGTTFATPPLARHLRH